MDPDNFIPAIDTNTDYTMILPIHQKRTIAFINHFIMSTISFINQFAQSCESRLMEFEYKMQKVEAALLILESQLSSIPGIDSGRDAATEQPLGKVTPRHQILELPEVVEGARSELVAGSDPRFSKFFKMVQVGVPTQAVKNKMVIEGLDPNILDKPNEVIPGGHPAEMGGSLASTSSDD